MGNGIRKAMVCCFCWIFLLTIAGCQGGETKLEIPELLEPVGVEMDTAKVCRGDLSKVTMYSGTVVPKVEELHFVIDGRLDEFKVVNGDIVQTGEILATLEGEELFEQIQELEAEIEEIRKNGEFSDRLAQVDIQIEQEELSELQKQGIYTESEAKKVNIRILQTKLDHARELRDLEIENKTRELNELSIKSANLEITAPFSGQVVYTKQVQQGDLIEGYSTVICLADPTNLTVSCDFISDQTIYGAEKIEAKIADKTYAVTHLPLENGEYAAKLLAGEEIKTRFLLEAAESLKGGEYVALLLYTSSAENVLKVPVNAVYRENKSKYVFKLVDGQRVRQDVKTGIATETEVEILEGLREGDVVYVKE